MSGRRSQTLPSLGISRFLFCRQIHWYGNRTGEKEQHHPDLHLVRYRHVQIELSTHTVDGLAENDCILAAKIDVSGPNE